METQEISFITLCKNFRIVTYTVTSLIYIILEYFLNEAKFINYWLILGMGVACFLGNRLYTMLEDNGRATMLTLSLELFAYGIFVFISGGFSSPYFWYYICCLLIVMNLKRGMLFVVIASVLCLLSAMFAGVEIEHTIRLRANIVLGVSMILGSFYILKLHTDMMKKQKAELEKLNKRIQFENERTEYALMQLSNIYETFDIIAMRDPEETIRLLVEICLRTIAPRGLVLMKLDIEGDVEEADGGKMEPDAFAHFLQYISSKGWDSSQGNTSCIYKDTIYELMPIGDELAVCGVLIRKQSKGSSPEKEKFFIKIIEMIFRNMDMHRHIEQYITTEEKQRIADEIHDTAIQKLFGLSLGLNELQYYMEEWDTSRLKSKIKELEDSTKLTMKELRETIYGKRFESESGESLTGRLELYMSEASKHTGAQITLDVSDGIDLIHSSKMIIIYRVCAESVNNALRHGEAKNIHVEIKSDEKRIVVMITDDGKGMGNNQVMPTQAGGNGLRNMRRMANLVKGYIVFENRESGGVRVKLTMPAD